MQFRLSHLLAVVAWVAVVLALYRFHTAIALLACPVTFGPLVGYVGKPTLEGAIVGFISAVFWCVLCGFVGVVLLYAILVVSGAHGAPPDALPLWAFLTCFVYFAASSMLGGYIGGRIAKS
ncbi:hypothetical protein RBSH_02051 [Rhodopirellula baltica SH28]|uniref:Uncharacterized protein n=2 Tax=Rhodopirellula baltica TaxID=265606 RepID=K5E9Z6_RHOBT|nr:hypothetical protein RBSH_02051 [Rhodopirellula baltica SH28]